MTGDTQRREELANELQEANFEIARLSRALKESHLRIEELANAKFQAVPRGGTFRDRGAPEIVNTKKFLLMRRLMRRLRVVYAALRFGDASRVPLLREQK